MARIVGTQSTAETFIDPTQMRHEDIAMKNRLVIPLIGGLVLGTAAIVPSMAQTPGTAS